MIRHLDVCPYGFGRDMSERVHWKAYYFYILLYFTLCRGIDLTGGVRGWGIHPPSQIFIIIYYSVPKG